MKKKEGVETKMENDSIQSIIIDNYKQYLQKLIKDFNEGKITYERFLVKAAEPLKKYANKQKMIAELLQEILDNAKDLEAIAEEVKDLECKIEKVEDYHEDLHTFIETKSLKISQKVSELRKILGLKPLHEYRGR